MRHANGHHRSVQERFGQRLRKARRQAGLTQSMVEELTGIDSGNLSAMENSHKLPSYVTLRALCMALQVPADYLLLRRGR